MLASDFKNYTVNIFETSELPGGDSTPVATIAEPSGGCPYDMALDKKATLYLADSSLSQVEEYPKGANILTARQIRYSGGIAYEALSSPLR